MVSSEFSRGGLEVVKDPALIAHLTIGKPNTAGDRIGPGYQPRSAEEAEAMARNLAEHTRKVNVPNAAYCIDERDIVQLGDITDPEALRGIVASRLPGGTGLAATKAAVAANAVIVRDTKNFNEAYDRVTARLAAAGIEDAGHAGCGARNNAASSVEGQIAPDTAFATLNAVGVARPGEEGAFAAMHQRKQELAASGYYRAFSPEAHETRLKERVPHHYATLRTEHDPVHGHHARGIYLPPEGMGLENGYVADTGDMSFVYTHGFAKELADVLGGSDEERRMIELGFGYDLLDVSNTLIAAPEGEQGQSDFYPGLSVFQQR